MRTTKRDGVNVAVAVDDAAVVGAVGPAVVVERWRVRLTNTLISSCFTTENTKDGGRMLWSGANSRRRTTLTI